MNIACVIPSRIASTRLAKKPLLHIHGKPMIQWVFEHASACPLINQVVIATDDERIARVIHQVGGTALLTDPYLPTGTDRVASVLPHLPHADVIINLQGDLPFFSPNLLSTLIQPYLNNESPPMTTLAHPLNLTESHHNPSAVKVILDQHQHAMVFSRAPIPYFRELGSAPVYHHIGIYAFTREFLEIFSKLSSTPLEKCESIEPLRVLEHGHRIKVMITQEKPWEINTQEDYEAALNNPMLECGLSI